MSLDSFSVVLLLGRLLGKSGSEALDQTDSSEETSLLFHHFYLNISANLKEISTLNYEFWRS